MTYNESEDAYYIQHGADSVPKKLGSGGFKRTTIFTGNSREGHTVNLSDRPGYQNFTLDNFCLKNTSLVYDSVDLSIGVSNIINSYNPTTGVLTLSKSVNSLSGRYFYINYSVDLIE